MPKMRRTLLGLLLIGCGGSTESTICEETQSPALPDSAIEREYVFEDWNIDRLESVRKALVVGGFVFDGYVEAAPHRIWYNSESAAVLRLRMLRTEQLDLGAFRKREAEVCAIAKQANVTAFVHVVPTKP